MRFPRVLVRGGRRALHSLAAGANRDPADDGTAGAKEIDSVVARVERRNCLQGLDDVGPRRVAYRNSLALPPEFIVVAIAELPFPQFADHEGNAREAHENRGPEAELRKQRFKSGHGRVLSAHRAMARRPLTCYTRLPLFAPRDSKRALFP